MVENELAEDEKNDVCTANSLRSDAKKSVTEAVSRKVELTAELPLRRTTRNTPSLLQSGVWLRRTSRSKWAFKDDSHGHFSKKKPKNLIMDIDLHSTIASV